MGKNEIDKKKIIFYVDWTDCIAHLTGAAEYSEGDTEEEKRNYTLRQVNDFFEALGKLTKKYDVDIHCVTGGCEDYLNGPKHGWIDLLHELFKNEGYPSVFKSVITEYGGDLLVGSNSTLFERPFEDSKILINEKLCENIKATIPEQYRETAEVTLPYKYFANIRFVDENLTEAEFNAIYTSVCGFNGHDLYTLYPYYCPGYGVEIDVLPKGLDKARGIETINNMFYSTTPKDDIALSVFNGDFATIDLRMTDLSLTKDVLFVGSEDADIAPVLEGQTLPYMTGGHKVACITNAMRVIASKDLSTHPYNKGSYTYEKK